MTDVVEVLGASVARLGALVAPLSSEQLQASAYPSDWTIADVMSHLGSSAIIMQRRVDAALTGEELTDDFPQAIWDEWNAKSPEDKAADGLAADGAFFERLESMSDDTRAHFQMTMGPLTFDFARLALTRLTEHTLHTWDIAVTLDPNATLPRDATEFVVDNLALVAQYTGRPVPEARVLAVATIDPARRFTLQLGPDAVSITPATVDGSPDLELPAETFIRLVYGRVDDGYDELRSVFPRTVKPG